MSVLPENFAKDKALRITSLTFSFVIAVYICYIILALCCYSYKRNYLSCCKKKRWGTTHRRQHLLLLLEFFAAIFALIYMFTEFPFVVSPSEVYCKIYAFVVIISYAGSISIVYFALWYRVYISFYGHPILKRTLCKRLQIVNKFTLVFLIIMTISNLTIFFLTAKNHQVANNSCVSQETTEANILKYIILAVSTTTFQMVLLFSFSWPLYTHRCKVLRSSTDNLNRTNLISINVLSVLKRTTFAACLCIVSDIVCAILLILDKNETYYLVHIVMATNLLFNLLTLILSFVNWKEKLLPFKSRYSLSRTNSVSQRYKISQIYSTKFVNTNHDANNKPTLFKTINQV